MMTILSVFFLVASIPFKGINLAIKVHSRTGNTISDKIMPNLKAKNTIQKVSKLVLKSLGKIFSILSKICSLLIPLDIYIFIIALLLTSVTGVIALLQDRDGVVTRLLSTKTKSSITSDFVYTDTNSNVNPTVDDGDYKKTDLGWILLFQGDSRWKSHQHGAGHTIGGAACGTTCACMVLTHYNSSNIVFRPDYMTEDYLADAKVSPSNPKVFAYASTACIPYEINNATSFYRGANTTTISVKCSNPIYNTSTMWQDIDSALDSGGCAILDMGAGDKYNGKSIWTKGGHYILIYASVGEGNSRRYRVLDPNGGHESTQSIFGKPYSTILFERSKFSSCKYYYIITKVN